MCMVECYLYTILSQPTGTLPVAVAVPVGVVGGVAIINVVAGVMIAVVLVGYGMCV